MALDAKSFYDGYWAARERTRTEARSRERARAALDLLALGGVRGGRLLDVGCGPGWALQAFQASGFTPVGVDASIRAVEEARGRGLDARVFDLEAKTEGRGGSACCAEALDPGASFDAVVALEVLEHLNDPLRALEKLRELLSPSGRIVVSLPNEIALPARLRVILGRLPFGGHDDPHVRHFDRRHARQLFDAAHLSVLSERPISILPPRWGLLRALARPAVSLFPGALSLATVYLLVPEALRARAEREKAYGS